MKRFFRTFMLATAVVYGTLISDVSASSSQRLRTAVTPVAQATPRRQSGTDRLEARPGAVKGIIDKTPGKNMGQGLWGSMSRPPRTLTDAVKIGKAGDPETEISLWGNVIYATSWEESGDYAEGVYSFPAKKNTSLTPIQIDENLYANGGGVFDGNLFRFVSYVPYSDGSIYAASYYEYDTRTWSMTKSQSLDPSQYGIIANIISHDPVSDRYYGIFPNPVSGTDFGYVDYFTMTKTVIAPTDNRYIAMAVNSRGEVYAVCQYGDLYKIDKNSGVSEYIGETGVYPASYLQSMAFDLDTDRLYWASQLANGKAWLCEIDTEYGEMTKISDFADDEEIVCLYVSRKIAEEGAPAKVSDMHVSTEKAESAVLVEFNMPNQTYGGAPLSGGLRYEIAANTEVLAEGNANAGEKVSVTVESPEGGVKFIVTAFNEVGKGEPESFKTWIGYDVPESVSNLIFRIDEETSMALLSWDASSKGEHGGYIENITYDVTRYPGGVVVATGIDETSWQEPAPSGNILEYSYEVTAINGNKRSLPTRSNTIITGDSYGIPYFCGFDSEEAFNEFTVLDLNNDGRTWVFNEAYNAISYTYSSENPADDWILSPGIGFQSSYLYNVSIKARSVNSSYPEKVSVWIGKGENPSFYECVITVTELEGSDWHTLSGNFNVPSDGIYRLGVKAESDAYMMQLQVDDIEIVENGKTDTPAEVTDLEITPASKGELKATVTFKAPTATIGGEELESIEKVVLYNGERIVDELPAAPGQNCYMVDSEPANGFNVYTVRAFNDKGAGMAISKKTYVGFDVPGIPSDIHVTDNDDHTTITWTAPGHAGENGGYVDPSGLTYTLYVVTGEGFVKFVESGITDTEYDDYSQIFTGDQDMISYCVTAENTGGEGKRGYSDDVVIIGEAYGIPFFESFSRGEFRYPLWWGTRKGETGFGKDVGSEDRDGGSVAWTPEGAADECWLNSGKISLAGTVHPVLSFSCKISAGADLSLAIEAAKEGKESVTLKTLDFTGDENGWQRILVDLSELKDERFIVIRFHGIADCSDKRLAIDRIRINDMHETDFAAEIEPKAQAICGESATYRIKVLNLGQKASDSYTVALYADGKKVAEAVGAEIAPMDEVWTEMAFRTPLIGSEIEVFAEVSSDGDGNPADNRSALIRTALVDTDVPAVTCLDGKCTDNEVILEWERPVPDDAPKTDGFEDYDAWSTDRFGRWTTANGNQGLTYAMNGIYFPLGGHIYSYTLFNPYDLGLDPEYVPQLAPYNGRQFAGAMAEFEFDDNDKWLISPRLSGNAQSISFYATALADFYTESFRVMYSTTGNEAEDFTELALTENNVTAQWKKYNAALPDGARYFAIHCNSNYGFGFFVDDVTFVPGYELTGYNIYRNGEFVTGVPADLTAYTLTRHPDGGIYTVTACYAEGESAHSGTYALSQLNVNNIVEGYRINGSDGIIAFRSINGRHVRISDSAGRIVYDCEIHSDCDMPMPHGIYIVTVENNIHKILVR